MSSLEQSVKDQFAKVYTTADWRLFKTVAEINLAEAATLKKADFRKVPDQLQLLVRNARKRLLIGVGVELLLKAVYLKGGYAINRPRDRENGPKLPFKKNAVSADALETNDTFTLDQLISQLKKVVELKDADVVLDGLKVAKVFRNKEGHVVTASHQFDPANYKSIAAALAKIYEQCFGERLVVQFSFATGEKGSWRVGAL